MMTNLDLLIALLTRAGCRRARARRRVHPGRDLFVGEFGMPAFDWQDPVFATGSVGLNGVRYPLRSVGVELGCWYYRADIPGDRGGALQVGQRPTSNSTGERYEADFSHEFDIFKGMTRYGCRDRAALSV